MSATDTIADEKNRHAVSPFERFVAVCATLSILGVWGVAFALEPDPRGLGTHEQLGLGECNLLRLTGVPCMFCGMTTSFTHLAQGEPAQAFHAQPAAVLLALFTIPAAGFTSFIAFRGVVPPAYGALLTNRRTLLTAACVLVAAWIYKIVQVV